MKNRDKKIIEYIKNAINEPNRTIETDRFGTFIFLSGQKKILLKNVTGHTLDFSIYNDTSIIFQNAESIHFKNCKLTNLLLTTDCKNSKNLSFSLIGTETEYLQLTQDFLALNIFDNSKVGTLSLTGIEAERIAIARSLVRRIDIDLFNIKKVIFRDAEIDDGKIYGLNIAGESTTFIESISFQNIKNRINLIIKDCNINELKFSDFLNNHDSFIYITRTSLGLVEILNSQLHNLICAGTKFSNWKVENSTIRDVDFQQIKDWGDVENLNNEEFYRQVKLCYQQFLNHPMALKFYAYEMSSLEKNTKFIGNIQDQDKLLLFFQKHVSYFGTDPAKAFTCFLSLWIILATSLHELLLLPYILLHLSLPIIYSRIWNSAIPSIWFISTFLHITAIIIFFIAIDCWHKISLQLVRILVPWDGASSIPEIFASTILYIVIYQLVISFRKYTRSLT